jgi:hypothetical protein
MFTLRSASILRAGFAAALALVAVSTAAPKSYGADTIPTWNVGSGQTRDNFVLDNNLNFDGNGNELQLGLRVQYRTSITPVPLDESTNTYTALAGTQQDGVVGASGDRPDRNRWNFDYHVYYEGGVQNLDSLTLTITSPAGNTVTGTGVFDLKMASNDNASFPAGDAQDPAFYIQDSQNPVFAPWFVPPFNPDVLGQYTFTLRAQEGASVLTQSMNVNVVPEPASLGLAGIAAVGLLMRRRRA